MAPLRARSTSVPATRSPRRWSSGLASDESTAIDADGDRTRSTTWSAARIAAWRSPHRPALVGHDPQPEAALPSVRAEAGLGHAPGRRRTPSVVDTSTSTVTTVVDRPSPPVSETAAKAGRRGRRRTPMATSRPLASARDGHARGLEAQEHRLGGDDPVPHVAAHRTGRTLRDRTVHIDAFIARHRGRLEPAGARCR